MGSQDIQNVTQDNIIVPMVIFFDNTCIHSCLSCKKASQKTLEQKHVWCVHPTSHKIVPLEPKVVITSVITHKTENNFWYRANAGNNPFEGINDIPVSIKQKTEKSEKISSNNAVYSDDNIMFLKELYQLIVCRKKEKKEGSYTAHLFNSGDDKIRKKFGEEAIEVILSKSKQEMTEESADLLYHLLVLFVNNDINIYDCLAVLGSRHNE